jgi:phage recombination protein Bet
MSTPALRNEPMTGALALQPGQSFWTQEQKAALASIGLADTPNADLAAFLHLCQTTGLDPFRREIYLIGRRDSRSPSGKKWTAQTGIDGYRHLAERTGKYGGRVKQEWCGEDGVWKDVWLDKSTPPAAARVTIKRDDIEHPIYGIAVYSEFVPMEDVYEGTGNSRRKTGQKQPGGLWGKMPANQLAKCAEAQALRAAFPRETAGLYTTEEMEQADYHARMEAESARDADQAQRRAEARQEALRASGAAIGRPPLVVVDQNGRVISDESDSTVPGEDHPEDAVLVEHDREALLAELADQAEVHGMSTASFCNRWVRAHKKNVNDATDDELADLVASRREQTAEAKALRAKHAAEDAERAKGAEVVDGVIEGEVEPTAEPTAETTKTPDDGHRYVENVKAKDGSCAECGAQWDDHPEATSGPDEPIIPVEL